MNRILLADFDVSPNFSEANVRYRRFLTNGKPRLRRLLDALIIHDEIVIPTHDFLGAAILVDVLGEKAIHALLEQNALRFIHIRGTAAYAGNGGGLVDYEITRPDGGKLPYWLPTDEAASWALSGLKRNFDRKTLMEAIVARTSQFDFRNASQALFRQTYEEVQSSSALMNWFGQRNTDLTRLYGVKPTTVAVYGGPDSTPDNGEVATLLRMLHCNLELAIALEAECRDLSTDNFYGLHLATKISEYNGQYPFEQASSDLISISGIPDLTDGIINKSISIDDIIRLREEEIGVEFRSWFHENCRIDIIETARRYTNLLKVVTFPSSTPGRILRFAVTSGLGLVPLVGGYLAAAAGAIDTFAMDSIVKGPAPKIFLDTLATLKSRKPRRSRTSK